MDTRTHRIAGIGVAAVVAWATPAPAAGLEPLQPLIDQARAGDVIAPPPGTYAGPIIVDKAVTLDGEGRVTIDGGGRGSVVVIRTDGATVRGLSIVGSGESHNDIDAGIQIRGNYNVVKDNHIADALFGIDLQQADNNVVRRNRIRSKPFDLGVRGDAIRLWYSQDNRIEDNHIDGARDMVVWYSAGNRIAGNTVSGGRYGLHFMYARHNVVEGNHYRDNSVGIFLMYSDGVEVRGNRISHGTGATGMGIGLKETSDVIIENNTVVYCGTGIYLDVSPFQPDTTNRLSANHIAFNGIGVLFHNDWTGNVLRDNRFEHNLVQVSVNTLASAKRNQWDGNFWDDYEGFDRDGDAVGDRPHELRVYADRLWMDVPHASFFRGSPVLGLLDFLERLAPFTEPIVLLRDDAPKMTTAVAAPAEEPTDSGRPDPFGLRQRLGR